MSWIDLHFNVFAKPPRSPHWLLHEISRPLELLPVYEEKEASIIGDIYKIIR